MDKNCGTCKWFEDNWCDYPADFGRYDLPDCAEIVKHGVGASDGADCACYSETKRHG